MSLLLQIFKIFVFSLGATCGIILAWWYIPNYTDHKYSIQSHPHFHPVTDSKYFNHWLAEHGLSREKNTCSKTTSLESDYLKQHIKITCVIFISNIKSAYRVYSSWVEKCDNFYFFGPNGDPFIPIITTTHSKYPWQRLCKSLEYLILNERTHLHWIILVTDDKFVIPENLRYSLVLINSTKPFYGGRIKSHINILYSQLNSGIVINVATLELLLQTNSLPCYLQNFYDADYVLGRQLVFHSVYPKSLLDENKCNRFHSISFTQMFSSYVRSRPDNYDLAAGHLRDKDGLCFSNTSVTFDMPDLTSKEMFETVYEYMLYHFRRTPLCYSASQYLSPPPYSEKIWAESISMYTNKSDENILAMTKEQYYKLWTNLTLELPQSREIIT
uniref:C1GALT1-specific chaperone 1 n=1 Tax=Cacopsylla melanoneura TaxID=428564 RepID=A0A8D8UN30_9HEMI